MGKTLRCGGGDSANAFPPMGLLRSGPFLCERYRYGDYSVTLFTNCDSHSIRIFGRVLRGQWSWTNASKISTPHFVSTVRPLRCSSRVNFQCPSSIVNGIRVSLVHDLLSDSHSVPSNLHVSSNVISRVDRCLLRTVQVYVRHCRVLFRWFRYRIFLFRFLVSRLGNHRRHFKGVRLLRDRQSLPLLRLQRFRGVVRRGVRPNTFNRGSFRGLFRSGKVFRYAIRWYFDRSFRNYGEHPGLVKYVNSGINASFLRTSSFACIVRRRGRVRFAQFLTYSQSGVSVSSSIF